VNAGRSWAGETARRGFGLAPQAHHPAQELAPPRGAGFRDQFLDAREAFRGAGAINGHG
jgi:hypothetical protein